YILCFPSNLTGLVLPVRFHSELHLYQVFLHFVHQSIPETPSSLRYMYENWKGNNLSHNYPLGTAIILVYSKIPVVIPWTTKIEWYCNTYLSLILFFVSSFLHSHLDIY